MMLHAGHDPGAGEHLGGGAEVVVRSLTLAGYDRERRSDVVYLYSRMLDMI
jgi:hypothetical protein